MVAHRTLAGPQLAVFEREIERVGDLGYAVSALAQVLEAMHELEEIGDCQQCPCLPQQLRSGYVRGGVVAALDALGGDVSQAGEHLAQLLRQAGGGIVPGSGDEHF